MRQRYFVFVSLAYIVLGLIILARSITAHMLPIAVLGIVFVLLGMVRLRDFRVSRQRSR